MNKKQIRLKELEEEKENLESQIYELDVKITSINMEIEEIIE